MTSDLEKKVKRSMQKHFSVNKVIIIFVVACAGLYFGYLRQSPDIKYGLMFDAGSTGSRVHVYSFNAETGALINEVFVEVKPGLSSYATPELAAQSLKHLMEVSTTNVPFSKHSQTPISLKATAGLRMLGEEKADKILQAVRDYFATFKFKLSPDSVKILEGSDEGVYAWFTVNYLLGRIGKERKSTVSIMDLGGGSTQIVFEPSEESLIGAQDGQVYNLNYSGRTYKLFQMSYERFGLMKAREKILLSKRSETCVPPQKTLAVTADGAKHEVKSGSPSFASCLAVASSILNLEAPCERTCSINGVFQPPLGDKSVFNDEMYAFSYFYDRTQIDGSKPVVSVGNFKEMAEEACQSSSLMDDHSWQCLDLSYMYALLSKGYKLNDDHKLNIAKKINGVETAWSLGAMVIQMAS